MFEEIILVLIYLYPGALVDVLKRIIYSYSFREDPSDNFGKAVRYFAYSVIISTLSLLLYGFFCNKGVHSIDNITASLNGTIDLAFYAGISFVITLFFTLLHRPVEIFANWLMTLILHTESVVINPASAWIELMNGQDLKEIRDHMIVRVTCGESVRSGFLFTQPDSFDDGLILTKTKSVSAQMRYERENALREDECLIGSPWATYYDPKTGTFVDMYDGREFSRSIKEKATTSSLE